MRKGGLKGCSRETVEVEDYCQIIEAGMAQGRVFYNNCYVFVEGGERKREVIPTGYVTPFI
jgi:hypothetical protein